MSEKDQFYLQKAEPTKGCLLALRQLILSQDELVNETVSYGMPCFCYGKKRFCYLWIEKKTREPYLLFVDGNLLDHPALESGGRKRMKILMVDSSADLPKKLIESVLEAAMALYRT